MDSLKLLKIWRSARSTIEPAQLLHGCLPEEDEAVIFWGKAAKACWEVCQPLGQRPCLVIAPAQVEGLTPAPLPDRSGCRWIEAEHPFPGRGSFQAGQALLEFFDWLRCSRVRRLRVYLSGGASSLAWVRPAGLSEEGLLNELRRLYGASVTIQQLNAARSRLCALKSGGAAAWLKLLAPSVRPRVEVISDVAPFGAEVVGSGPFWDGRIPHRILADNATLVRSLKTLARKHGERVILEKSGWIDADWKEWAKTIESQVSANLVSGRQGLLIFGGEPKIALPPRSRSGKGGRQTQIAAALLSSSLLPFIGSGKVEALCMSTDGVDGTSGSSGTILNAEVAKRFASARARQWIKDSVRCFNTAPILEEAGALLPANWSGTNVQDLVIVRIRGRY